MDLASFRRLPLVGILRGVAADDLPPLAEAAIGAGLTTIEITMNTPGAAALIARLRAIAGERLMVGAGTVLDLEALAAARDAGASFIVMPTLVTAVVERCVAAGVPVFPGALTPQEIHTAWTAGATMVKVFPAGVFGPAYLRDVKGPFESIELMAVGGIDADNLATYFACGASAVAFGASVFRRDWLAARAYDRIATEVGRLVTACTAARPG